MSPSKGLTSVAFTATNVELLISLKSPAVRVEALIFSLNSTTNSLSFNGVTDLISGAVVSLVAVNFEVATALTLPAASVKLTISTVCSLVESNDKPEIVCEIPAVVVATLVPSILITAFP